MLLFPILAIIFVSSLRSTLKKSGGHPEWNKKLLLWLYISIGILVLSVSIPKMDNIGGFIGFLYLAWLMYFSYREPIFYPSRSLVLALLPMVALSFASEAIEIINKPFSKTIHDYLQIAVGFSFLWLITMLIITNKQKKRLEKERKIRLEEEERNRMTLALKAQLEVEVAERTLELTHQKEALEQALTELKSTQTQLIHAEKMASLGELTAGIAHEIQNPLNFVNNFSELTAELLEEMKAELQSGNTNEVIAIAGDIEQNLQKITHHGKRADSIVKGMLQHSRSSFGKKEPADINVLADEYLRLSYHGLRAKDKSFNAKLETNFDNNIGNVNIIAQDVGRVLLNLFTNAFYAVAEKKQHLNGIYDPVVSVKTQKLNGKVSICVRDNGTGIPQTVLDKIYQPFFTTKPTGQGTGLGLSMSYDIITNGHGGEIKVNTAEGEFAEFTILLPI